MQKAATTYTAALAAGFLNRKHCGEPDAGPFCIAAPKGIGKIAEVMGSVLSLVYGGYHSIVAIETPGGDDDQQWLTFWIILVGSMFLEKAVMEVMLSKFPLYYETKLLLLIWLMFFGGATHLYRRLRRKLSNVSTYFEKLLNHRSDDTAQRHLDIMTDIGGDLIVDQVAILERNAKRNPARRSSAVVITGDVKDDEQSWEYDYTSKHRWSQQTTMDSAEKLYVLSKWLLSLEGFQEMEKRKLPRETIALLLERAAALISFNPRYLNILLIGTKSGPGGCLPIMDRHGKVNAYVKFFIQSVDNPRNGNAGTISADNLSGKIVSSRIAYSNRSPTWNEKLELFIKAGNIEFDGNYRDKETKHKIVVAEVWDADVGAWGVGLDVFQVSFLLVTTTVFVGHVTGALDSWFDSTTTRERAWAEIGLLSVFLVNFLGLTVCYLMSVVFRADDEFIGSSAVPLDLLLDQREHALLLKLQNVKESKACGILRVQLSLSE